MITSKPHIANVFTYGIMLFMTERAKIIRSDTGDFDGRRHPEIVAIINHAIDLSNASYWGSTKHEQDTCALLLDTQQFKERVSSYGTETRDSLIKKYLEADKGVTGGSAVERIAARVAMLDGVDVTSDFDGTYTQNPDDYLYALPGNHYALPKFDELGRERFAKIHTASFRSALEVASNIFADGGEIAQLREGVPEFHQYCSKNGVRINILSANFEPFIHRGLSDVGIHNADVWGIRANDITATEKGDAVRYQSIQSAEQKKARLFIGDRGSDRNSIDANNVVAGYLALERESFSKDLTKAGIDHLTYRDFNDVLNWVVQINTIANQMREERSGGNQIYP